LIIIERFHGTCALSPQYISTAEWHQSNGTSPHNTYCGEGCHRFDAIPLSNCIVGITRMYRGVSTYKLKENSDSGQNCIFPTSNWKVTS